MRVLAVSDEVHDGLARDPSSMAAELIVSCGDLPQDYLAQLMAALDAPLVFVPGNHDADVSGYRLSRAGLMLRAGLPAQAPWPAGAISLEGRIAEVGGLTVAGLGGSVRYREGPNQYTQRQFARRVRRLLVRQGWRRLRGGSRIDVVITHTPPAGVGDGDDPAHRGFDALHHLVARLQPQYLLHGHVHPYGSPSPDRRLGMTLVHNVVGASLIEVGSRPAPRPVGLSHGT